ncbi:exonuclease domain-containing protein [Streptomyces sp. NBC_00582]|uniref:exonuclease domain-containing protein n=1 Tax=Streptomyces sp. NBC_00582 TaxID=2975783 RepID=UPI002E7FE749|nr:exonuclease domain-containing protein [Streptomyces sp. NBC_00582]WUB64649.1 exonuclease domain-containing protein [Streptomyces sp. NBC_00582]
MTWHLGRLAAFDLETTGVDVETDRIVTAAVDARGGGMEPEAGEWLADPGVEIPVEAYEIHKISTEHARENGDPAEQVVHEVTAELAAQVVKGGAAIVGHNVPFDLTMLDRECRRYGLPTLHDRLAGHPLHVIDTRVIDQHAVPYRKRVSETQGARQLITLAQFYGLPWDDEAAHGCSYDAIAAARIACRIGLLAHSRRRDWPEHVLAERRLRFNALRDLTLAELHARQIEWAAEQAAGLQKHFRKTDPDAVVDGAWPLRPWVEPTAAEGASA